MNYMLSCFWKSEQPAGFPANFDRGRGQRQHQPAGPLRIVIDADVRHARILRPLVADTPAGVVVLLVRRRIQRCERQAQARALRQAPRRPIELEWDLDLLAAPYRLGPLRSVAKARPAYVLAELHCAAVGTDQHDLRSQVEVRRIRAAQQLQPHVAGELRIFAERLGLEHQGALLPAAELARAGPAPPLSCRTYGN